jgi:hypothetical protein
VSASTEVLLDEHVSRVFERVLGEQGYHVEQAKDRFGERTVDSELLYWCAENEVLFLSNNARDFEALHQQGDHAGVLLVYDQALPDNDPEGLGRTVDEVISQYGTDGLANELVDLDAWYDRLHG